MWVCNRNVKINHLTKIRGEEVLNLYKISSIDFRSWNLAINMFIVLPTTECMIIKKERKSEREREDKTKREIV